MRMRVPSLRAFIVCGAFVVALLATGCWEPEPSPEPPPPPVTNPEKLAPHVRSNSYYRTVTAPETGLYADESFWVDSQRSKRTTVAATLIELGAALRDGKVVDAAGEELFFGEAYDYDPVGQEDWEKLLREAEKKYHVVRMYGPPPPVNPVLLAKQIRRGLNEFGLSLDDDWWFEVPGARPQSLENRSQGLRPMTVRTKLYDLGARLVNGKVVDANGKELCFFYVHTGRNADPGEDEAKVQQLEKKYRVIRMQHKPREE
jgi:hypothetical protein